MLAATRVRLNILRSVAALLVVIGHWRIVMFVDYARLVSPSPAIKLLYFMTGLGRSSVMLFFVLSGYLVTASAMRSINKGQWSIRDYIAQRVTRLIVVLLPALALCWFWDSLGLHFVPHGLYDGSIHTAALSADLAGRRSLGTLLQNSVFLQGVTARTYGSNDPLWSLSYEFWYYMLLIPIIEIVRGHTISRRLLGGVSFLLGLWFVGRTIDLYFSIWLIGSGVAVVARSRSKVLDRAGALGPTASVLLMTAVMMSIRARYLPEGFIGHFLLGCTCALFIYSAVCDGATYKANGMTAIPNNIAEWSYSLYLLHMPFLLFVASLVIREKPWSPDMLHLVRASSMLAIVILYAYVVSLLIERRTDAIRRLVKRVTSAESYRAMFSSASIVHRAPRKVAESLVAETH